MPGIVSLIHEIAVEMSEMSESKRTFAKLPRVCVKPVIVMSPEQGSQ